MRWIVRFFAFCYGFVFGCHHGKLSRPFTLEAQTYKVCLDCGKQVFYSLDTMRPLSARELRRAYASQEGSPACVEAMPAIAHHHGFESSNAAA